MTLEDLLAGYGKATTGTAFKLDEEGLCTLGFHGDRSLVVDPDPETNGKVCIHATVASLPERDLGLFCAKLLTANLYGVHTGDAWFALDPARLAIVLNRTFDTTTMQLDGFTALLTGFMDTVELWSRELDRPDFAAADDAALAPTGLHEGGLAIFRP